MYENGQLFLEKYGTTILEFQYNAEGKPYCVYYSTNGGSSYVKYYYMLNLQGDVAAMMDTGGVVAINYTYDPWGKVVAIKDSNGNNITSATHMANANPLRYRGYYYDRDTQLYYLQSRYYDPEVGRFINADSRSSTGQGILGLNMFAYCGNNPISRIDSLGSTYEEVPEEYRPVGAGLQIEIDMGNVTTGVEVIVYWDVSECGGDSIVIAAYTYSGGSVDFLNENLGSIIATITDNIDLIKSGGSDGVLQLVNLLKGGASISVSGLVLFGNDEFTSVRSYEGPFLSMSASANHVKGGVALSNSCVAIALGGTSSPTANWGLSLTNYTLRSVIRINKPEIYRSYLGM